MAKRKASAKLADFIAASGGFNVVFAIPIGYDRHDLNAWVTAHVDGDAKTKVFVLQMSACRRFAQQLSSRRVMWMNPAVENMIPCPVARIDRAVILLTFIREYDQMKIFSRKPFKSLAFAGALAMVVSTAYAVSYADCQPSCQQNAQNAYNSAYSYYTTQQTNYCNSLTDPNAKSACLAAVPSYASQQAQNVYNQVYNSCMQSCTAV